MAEVLAVVLGDSSLAAALAAAELLALVLQELAQLLVSVVLVSVAR